MESYRDKVDLVVTDIVMPGMSGGELSQRIARRSPATRILFTSGFTDDEVVRRGLMVSGRPFLQKPWSTDSLVARIRAMLDEDPRERRVTGRSVNPDQDE